MLVRKILRDIRKNKVQFLAIFLMMFMGCFLFSGITGEWNGLKEHFDRFIEEQNIADVWAYKQVSEDERKTLCSDKRIAEAEGRMVLPVILAGKEDTSLDCYIAKENRISRLYILEGISFDSERKGVWLDASFARENHYKLGDMIELQYNGLQMSGKILGLAYSPEYIYSAREGQMMADHKSNGFVFASPQILPEGIDLSYNQLAVKTEEKKTEGLIGEVLGEEGIAEIAVKDHPSVSMIQDEIDQHRSIGTVFSVAFLFIAVMIAMTTMHRMMKNQKLQIGILKALGFTKAKLTFHYISHNSVICLAGAVCGYVMGYQVLPGMIYDFMKELYVLPYWGGSLPASAFILPFSCAALCIAISFFICRKYLRADAAQILYGQEDCKDIHSLPEAFEVMDFSGKWNLRDIMRNRLRSFMTLFGILGCTALLFCAFALYDTFQNLSVWTFTNQQQYQCKVTELPEEGKNDLLHMMDGEYLMEGSAIIQGEDKKVALTVPETTRYLKLYEDLNTVTSVEEGVAVSKKTADSLGVKKGDFITWKMEESKAFTRSEIKKVIRTPLSQGILMMKSDYEKAGQSYEATAIIGEEPADGFGNFKNICTITYQKDMTENVDSMMDGMVTMIMMLVIGAVLLGSVMLYNLGILSYMERYREFATMKVLGFADKKIRKIMIQQNIWLSALGILLGIPAGYGLLFYMLSTIPDSMDILVYVKAVSWIVSILGTLFLSFIISSIVSRKIPHINMVEALKARE